MKERSRGRRLFAVLLSMAIALTFMGLDFAAVSAEDTEPAATAKVTVRLNDENNQPAKMYSLDVSSLAAEEAGIAEADEDSGSVVTAVDVFTALHTELFGEAFTQDPSEYIIADWDENYVEKAYGHEINALQCKVNNGLTGMMNLTPVNDGDEVAFYTIFDDEEWSDTYVFFKESTPAVDDKGNVSLTVQYAEVTYDEETFEPSQNDIPVENATVTFKGEKGEVQAVTGSDGVAHAALTESGTYTASVTATPFGFAALPAEMKFDVEIAPVTPVEPVVPAAPVISTPAVNSVHAVGGSQYKVTSGSTVYFVKAKNAKSVTVPAAININGHEYAVSGIGAKAFKGTKAKTVTIKTKLLTKASVKKCLKGSKVKTIKVKVGTKAENKKFLKKYKKIFTKKNAGLKVTVK